jgi:hypothetical protein
MNYGGQYYLIERKSVKLKVKKNGGLNLLNSYEFTCGFWRSDEKGTPVENIQDVKKKNTDTAITELFGDIADFALSNLLNKEAQVDLLLMTPSEQIKTLKHLFRLEIYDEYREVNKRNLIGLQAEIAKLMGEKHHYEALITAKTGSQGGDLTLLETEFTEHVALISEMEDNERGLLQEKNDILASLAHVKEKIQPCPVEKANNELLKTLSKEVKTLPQGTDTGLAVSSFNFKIKLLEKALDQCPSREDLIREKEALELPAEDLEQDEKVDPIEPVKGSVPVERLIDQTTDKLKHLLVGEDPFPELEMKHIVKRLAEQQALLVPLSSNFAAIEAKIADLPPEEEDDLTEFQEEWLAENARDLAVHKREVTELEQRKTRLNKTRSGVLPTRSKEELVALITETAFSDVRDTSRMASIGKDIDRCNDQLNKGERGRVKKLIGLVKQATPSLEDREQIIAYLEEKYAGVHDPRLLGDMEHLKKLEKEYQTFVYMEETNATIRENQKLKKEVDEWDYRDILRVIEGRKTEYDGLLMYKTILTDKQGLNRRARLLAELNLEKRNHLANQDLHRSITELHLSIDCKKRKGLEKELHRYKAVHLRQLLAKRDELEDLLIEREKQEAFDYFNQVTDQIEQLEIAKANEKYRVQIRGLTEQLQDIQTDIDNQVDALGSARVTCLGLEKQLSLAKYKQEELTGYRGRLESLQGDIIAKQQGLPPYECYDKLVSNRGIPCKLLFLKIKAIEGYINRIIEAFTKYRVHILYDEAKQTISIITENKTTGEHLSIQRLSGYEKLMLQVAFKRALNKFSYNSKSSLIIIDEALDCIDSENFLTRLPEVMNMIAQDYAIAIAISQRDISHISDRSIGIRIENGTSKLMH